jgi:hypothetical protein
MYPGPSPAKGNLVSFTTRADPQPEDVALTIDGDSDRGVDGPVGDLAVPDLGSGARCVIEAGCGVC